MSSDCAVCGRFITRCECDPQAMQARIAELEAERDDLRNLVRDFINKYEHRNEWPFLFANAREALSGGDDQDVRAEGACSAEQVAPAVPRPSAGPSGGEKDG